MNSATPFVPFSALAPFHSGAGFGVLHAPVPILRGSTPEDYAHCAASLALSEWPTLVGVGSVRQRPVHGPQGILTVLAVLDEVLPAHTSLHLLGVGTTVLAQVVGHPRLADADAVARHEHDPCERRIGREMDFRIGHVEAWSGRQRRGEDREQRLRRGNIQPAACRSAGVVPAAERSVLGGGGA